MDGRNKIFQSVYAFLFLEVAGFLEDVFRRKFFCKDWRERVCSFGADLYFCGGELAEWSIEAVLKTVECNSSGGSNPSLSA